MKIIYEASVISNANFDGNTVSKTGVYRVAQQLFENLNNHKAEIALASTDSLPELMAYVEKNGFKCINTTSSQRKAKFLKNLFSMPKKGSFLEKSVRFACWKLGVNPKNGFDYDINELKKFDIFHSPFHPFPKEILGLRNPRKLITIHDLIPKVHPEFFGENHVINMNKILNGIDEETFVSCVSESTRNDLLNEKPKVNPENVSVISLAADSTLFYQEKNLEKVEKTLKKYKIYSGKPYFLSVSTLEPRKNLARTIKAFAKLVEQENLKDLQLVLVGSKGWKLDALLETLKANESIKKQIIITGFVADEDLAAIYSGALGFVYPSLYEGFGLPPLEAMQCGIPVITSNNSSLPEVVGDAGMVVDATDENAIAECFSKLYNDLDFRDDLVKKSLIQAKKFTWNQFQDDYWNLYQSIIYN